LVNVKLLQTMNNLVSYLVCHVVTMPKIAGTVLVILNSQMYIFPLTAPLSVVSSFILKHGLYKFSFQLILSLCGSTITALVAATHN
jgi:hypothetical protein